jgi:D-alanyl-lipoteichoic acid acyltransferase DltB (MBOAT superfamily)
MLFNSDEFWAFFGLFFTAYVLTQRYLRLRNLLIVISSFVFYSAWDPRFSALLFLTCTVDYSLARAIDATSLPARRRSFLVASLVFNLGVLGTFKYFNFFRESFLLLLETSGLGVLGSPAWDVVLPVGISFYTFQSISYTVDVYRRHVPATRDFVQYVAYVAFFPQLVAGPIERGAHLLPQFVRTLRISLADVESAIWLITWGMFKKVVLSNNLAGLVALVYDGPVEPGPIVWLGTIAFGLQIYCDFSGYSDIARGLARLLGFDLMLNFNLPYFARNLRDFWGRWHISLSTWLRDYLYIPLGGNRRGEGRTCLNLAITMLLGGLWHGAAANFVLWGAWHGAGLIGYHWLKRHSRLANAWPGWVGWTVTQLFVLYGWMLFRAHSSGQIVELTAGFFAGSFPSWWDAYACNVAVLALPLLCIEVWQWRTRDLEFPLRWQRWPRALLIATMVLSIAAFWQEEPSPFIYFQF